MKFCPCGEPIVKKTYETIRQFERRESQGYCKPKCKKTAASIPKERTRTSLLAVSWNHERPERIEQWKEKPERDEKYLDWIRGLTCLICGGPSEAHHQNRRKHGGKSTTASDYRALCLCSLHHTGGGSDALPGSYHGLAGLTGWRFWEHYRIDVEATITRLNEEYNRMQANKRRGRAPKG